MAMYDEAKIAGYWNMRFKEAMVSKADYTKKWTDYWNAYEGEYFKNTGRPEYKSDLVSNYIFSIIETIRPIMLDNDPKFQSIPRQPSGMKFANDLQEILSYEWEREDMSRKLYRELITTLVTGTSIFFLPWNSEEKEVKSIMVSPYNIFPDPLATSVEDAEFIIYASYRHVGRLKRLFPDKADRLSGGQVNYGELVHDNNEKSNVLNQVLVLEIWTRDYDTHEEEKDSHKKRLKYPNGRVITLCPELGVVLKDVANPYSDGRFPFVLLKDYDIPGKFWGEGEVAQLLSPQKHMNDLNNAILDNAKTTANMPWIIDKNAGVAQGKITARPGLIIRKNPGSEVRREQPPGMPAYVINAVSEYKADMEQISGIFDTLKGNSETGVYTAQGILALQEAGQARIRLKVKIMEDSLGKLANMWFSRMKQFWKEDRWIRISLFDGSYDMRKFRAATLKEDYDVRILAGSTMPVNRGAMLDLMIRLAQTQMPDGSTLVDREAVAEYLPQEVKNALLARAEEGQTQVQQQIQQLAEQLAQIEQALQQFVQQDQQDDAETVQTIEELASAIEQINQQIVQVKQANDMLEEEKQRLETEKKLKDDAYNSGYADAETTMSGPAMTEDLGSDPDLGLELPPDLLNSLETLSDDELAVLLASNPELSDLLS